jgi:uncharacterized protein (TIGR02611 family)
VEGEERGERRPLIDRVRERRDRHKERHRLYRFGFAGVGFLVVCAGIVMLVTPGPGIAVIILGLGMLALEFSWAERWLERLLDRAEQAVDQVTRGSRVRQALLIGAGAIALVTTIVVAALWDLPYLPG